MFIPPAVVFACQILLLAVTIGAGSSMLDRQLG